MKALLVALMVLCTPLAWIAFPPIATALGQVAATPAPSPTPHTRLCVRDPFTDDPVAEGGLPYCEDLPTPRPSPRPSPPILVICRSSRSCVVLERGAPVPSPAAFPVDDPRDCGPEARWLRQQFDPAMPLARWCAP